MAQNLHANKTLKEVMEQFSAFQRCFFKQKHDFLYKNKLTSQQVEVLFALSGAEVKTVKQLAESLNNSSSATTQLVEGLVKLGYLSRSLGKNDRRTVQVFLTKKGLQKYQYLKKSYVGFLTKLFSNLSQADLKAYKNILNKLTVK